MAVVKASLSAAGYEKARTLMKLDAFLGELVGARGCLASGPTSCTSSVSLP